MLDLLIFLLLALFSLCVIVGIGVVLFFCYLVFKVIVDILKEEGLL